MLAQNRSGFYDVLIIGGGMVGATLGCCLGGSGFKVAIIEDSQPQPFLPDQSPDLRVSALSLSSRTIMDTLDTWKGVSSRRHCPFRRMRVWEERGVTEFCSDDINLPELGHIVENRIIQLALLEGLAGFDNVSLFCPAKSEKIAFGAERSEVKLADGRMLKTRLLVAADGGQSRVRQAAGLGVISWDYKQHALVISVETNYPQQDITWQRFTPTGPQAFLPLSGNYASLVWYHSPDEIRRLKSLTDEALLAEIVTSFPENLGEIKGVLGRASFPLKRQHALDYVREGVALIGDAAHIINPLAGQGVNIGFLDAATLAEVLVSAREKGHDHGSRLVLSRYERLRRKNNLLMMNTMEAFYRVFSNHRLPLKFIRNVGLSLAERLQPAKNKVMRYAIGLEGNLPRLAQGKTIISCTEHRKSL